jgi:hypothetical protein
VAGLAAIAPVGRSTVYNDIRSRKLDACTWRGRLVIPEAAAREYLAVLPLDDAADSGAAEPSSGTILLWSAVGNDR